MRISFMAIVAGVSLAAIAAPATASLVGTGNYDFSTTPLAFDFHGSSFTFSNTSKGVFDFDPVSVATSGAGEVTAFGGFLGIPLEPSTFFTRFNVVFGPDLFSQFASFAAPAVIPGSIVESDLGLRIVDGADTYYGYARFAGTYMESIAFQGTPNGSITAGSFAAPEPASWAMMLGGFAFAGAALRRARRTTVRYA